MLLLLVLHTPSLTDILSTQLSKEFYLPSMLSLKTTSPLKLSLPIPDYIHHTTFCCYSRLSNLFALQNCLFICVSSSRSMFYLVVDEVAGIIVPILQIRNQGLIKMKKLSLRFHHLQWQSQDSSIHCLSLKLKHCKKLSFETPMPFRV